MSSNASNSGTAFFDEGPVPAYEANPTPLPDMQTAAWTQSTAPAMDDITVYGAVTVQQQSGTTPNNNDQNSTIVSENKYALQPVSPVASPAPQQMQQLPPQQQQLQLTPQQQQLLQLTPQQQQLLLLQSTPQQPQIQQFTPQQPQMQQLPLQQAQQPQQQFSPQLQQQQPQQRYQTAVRLANLQEAGAPVDCPVCGYRELTIVEKVSGNTTHAWAAMVCIFTGLGCIPYLMHGLKDAQHKCGHCGVLLARWHKSGRTTVFQHA